MKLDQYYQKILEFCTKTPLIIDFHLNFEEMDVDVGYLTGVLDLADGSK